MPEKEKNTNNKNFSKIVPDLDISVVKKGQESFIERHEIEEISSLICSEEHLSEFIKEVATNRKEREETRREVTEEDMRSVKISISQQEKNGNFSVLKMIKLQDYEGVFTKYDTRSDKSDNIIFKKFKKIIKDLKKSHQYSEKHRDQFPAKHDKIPKGLIQRHRVPRIEEQGHERFIEGMRNSSNILSNNDYRQNKPAMKIFPSSIHAYVAKDLMKVRRYDHDCADSKSKPDSNPKFITVKTLDPDVNKQRVIQHREDYEGFFCQIENPLGKKFLFENQKFEKMMLIPRAKHRGFHQDYEYAEDPMPKNFFEVKKLKKFDFENPPKIVNKMDFPKEQQDKIIEDRYTFVIFFCL